jgi:hypothetical protein
MSEITVERLEYGLPRLQEAIPDFTLEGKIPTSVDSYYTDGSAQGSIYKVHIIPKQESYPVACVYIWASGEVWLSFSNTSPGFMGEIKKWLLSLRGLA